MNPQTFKDWFPLVVTVIGWIIAASVGWQKAMSRINGLGGRVKKVEENCSNAAGRMDRFERELSEYRRDAQDAIGRMGRVEKGVDDLKDTIQNGQLAVGAQLHMIEKLIQEKDSKTQIKLVRIETVQQIEKKIGPLPTD